MIAVVALAPGFPRGEPPLTLCCPSSVWPPLSFNSPFQCGHPLPSLALPVWMFPPPCVPGGHAAPRPSLFLVSSLGCGIRLALCVLGKVCQQQSGPQASLILPKDREALLRT